jgi:hypothetical protein
MVSTEQFSICHVQYLQIPWNSDPPAEYNSAIRQVKNLCYNNAGAPKPRVRFKVVVNQPSAYSRLPLRHEVGERVGERWCLGFRGRSFGLYSENLCWQPL